MYKPTTEDDLFHWLTSTYRGGASMGIYVVLSTYYGLETSICEVPQSILANPDPFLKRLVDHYKPPRWESIMGWYEETLKQVDSWPLTHFDALVYWRTYAKLGPTNLTALWTDDYEKWLQEIVKRLQTEEDPADIREKPKLVSTPKIGR